MVGAEPAVVSPGAECLSDALPLFVQLLVLVELGRIAESQDLPAGVAREDAMRALRFKLNDRDVPRTGAIRRRHAAARQAFERFELEHCCRRSYVTQRSRGN